MRLGEAKRVNIAPDTLKVDANDHSRNQAGNDVAILNDLEQPLILGQYSRRDEKSDQRQEKSQHAQNLIIVDGITIDFVWNTVRPGELYHDRRDKCQYNQPNMRPDSPEGRQDRLAHVESSLDQKPEEDHEDHQYPQRSPEECQGIGWRGQHRRDFA